MSFQNISPSQLQALRQSGCVLVDVRTDAEVARGVIDGAKHMVLATLPGRAGELPLEGEVVFYCQSGGRSAQACHWFAAQGGKSVFNLQGGVLAWQREGYPLHNPS